MRDDDNPSDVKLSGYRFRRADLLLELPPTSWLIDGVVPAGSSFMLYGEPGLGKSFLALDWAFCIATGSAWQSRPVKAGPVVYIAAEGIGGLPQRIAAWDQVRGWGTRPDVWFVTDALRLTQERHMNLFRDALHELSPVAVFVDTLARNMAGGDEDAAKDMNLVIESISAMCSGGSTAVGVLHHPTKNGRSERGSTALRGALDTIIRLVRQGQTLTLKCEKQKDGDPFTDITCALRKVDLGARGSSCVVVESAVGPEPSELDKAHSKALALLVDSADALGNASWEAQVGTSESSFNRLKRHLLAKGFIEQRKVGRETFYRATDLGNRYHGQIAVKRLSDSGLE